MWFVTSQKNGASALSLQQVLTAKRVWERLNAEHGFGGGYTVVKDYVRQGRLRHKEMFVPLTHPPGDAQADFGEALVVVGGAEQKGHFLRMDLVFPENFVRLSRSPPFHPVFVVETPEHSSAPDYK